MMFSKRVENAILFAAKAHVGQIDKSRAPYILHPLRVGLAFSLLPKAESEIIVGLLHDVFEDTDAVLSDVAVELDLTEEEVSALDAISKRKEEDYPTYLSRVGSNRLAKDVKYEDLRDNIGRTIGAEYISDKDKTRMLRKYITALAFFGLPPGSDADSTGSLKIIIGQATFSGTSVDHAAQVEEMVSAMSYDALIRTACLAYPESFSIVDGENT